MSADILLFNYLLFSKNVFSRKRSIKMARYICTVCGYVYDEDEEGTPFADLPDTWECPVCGEGKDAFELE